MRTRSVLGRLALATAALAGVLPLTSAAASSTYTTNCPPAESLVKGTNWHGYTLAPGVAIAEGTRWDDYGQVSMHVLRVALGKPSISVRPLLTHLANRETLSQLARGRSGLVAATNSGYFDFDYGTPSGPVVVNGVPYLASTTAQPVVGLDKYGHAQAGLLHLHATVTVGSSRRSVQAVDVLTAPSGVTVYDARWGAVAVPLPKDALDRTVLKGKVASGTGRFTVVPVGGMLLVARGVTAHGWLSSLRRGQTVAYTASTLSNTTQPFRSAYGVGTQLVVNGVARGHLSCRRSDPMPARTAIGFSKARTTLYIVEVEDEFWSQVHGLDSDQMARVLADLGIYQAFALDGSGSTEMLAKVAAAGNRACQRTNVSTLSCRTFPADGKERPMPLGIGVFVS